MAANVEIDGLFHSRGTFYTHCCTYYNTKSTFPNEISGCLSRKVPPSSKGKTGIDIVLFVVLRNLVVEMHFTKHVTLEAIKFN